MGRVDAQLLGAVFADGDAKAPGLEPLVEDDEAAVVPPGEDLHADTPTRDEDGQRAGVHVLLPGALTPISSSMPRRRSMGSEASRMRSAAGSSSTATSAGDQLTDEVGRDTRRQPQPARRSAAI